MWIRNYDNVCWLLDIHNRCINFSGFPLNLENLEQWIHLGKILENWVWNLEKVGEPEVLNFLSLVLGLKEHRTLEVTEIG